jgi:hypothetical protein
MGELKMEKELDKFMKTFVLGDPLSLDDIQSFDFRGQEDRDKMRWHVDTARIFKERAEACTDEVERRRLMNKYHFHLEAFDRIYYKYAAEIPEDAITDDRSYEEVADHLLSLLNQ